MIPKVLAAREQRHILLDDLIPCADQSWEATIREAQGQALAVETLSLPLRAGHRAVRTSDTAPVPPTPIIRKRPRVKTEMVWRDVWNGQIRNLLLTVYFPPAFFPERPNVH